VRARLLAQLVDCRGGTLIRVLPLVCLILFHSSDGSLIWIKSSAITTVKPILPRALNHIAKGTHAVVYTVTGRTFAVQDTSEDIVGKVDACDKGS
jgi:hypothetical protein